MTQRIVYKEFLPEVLGPVYMNRFGLSLIDEVSEIFHKIDSNKTKQISVLQLHIFL